MKSKKNLQELKADRERWITRIFWLGLEIAIIFAIPAALGAWIGTRLGGGTVRILILAGTFILSWSIVAMRYRQTTKKLKSIEAEIAALESEDEISE